MTKCLAKQLIGSRGIRVNAGTLKLTSWCEHLRACPLSFTCIAVLEESICETWQ